LSEGDKSGLKYYVDAFDYQGTKSIVGIKIQLIDDDRAAYVSDPTHRLAILYDLIAPDITRFVHPPGVWNELRIVSDEGHVEYWLNGRKVLSFSHYEENFKKWIADSKYRNWTSFGLIPD